MNDDTPRRLQITTESIKTDHTSVVVAAMREEINMLRRQLAAAKLVISGLDLRAEAHGNKIKTLAVKAVAVAGERAANAVLTTEIDRLRLSLTWIATVNAMDYEYQAKARTALGLTLSPKQRPQPNGVTNAVLTTEVERGFIHTATSRRNNMTTYTSIDGQIVISARRQGVRQVTWALYVGGQYKGSKVLPANNTAIVQNFGYYATDFNQVAQGPQRHLTKCAVVL